MDGVRKVANTGRTVVCTIHQPSWDVFDSLLLLKLGGKTVYFGELGTMACDLVKYFEAIPGVAPLEEGYNPATWMLEVIGAGVGNAVKAEIDFVAAFLSSAKKALLDQNLARPGMCTPAPGVPALEFKSKRAASNLTQARFVIGLFMTLYWRTPSYTLTRVFVNIILGLIMGLAYFNVNYETYQGINAGQGLVFSAIGFIRIISFNQALPLASEERASFYRERAAETYNAFWYLAGATLAEIPYVAFNTMLYLAIFFPLVGFTGVARFFMFWFNLTLHALLRTYMGHLCAYAQR